MKNPSTSTTDSSPAIADIAQLLRSAERVLVITGAGVSVESGLPTYRGIGGLYEVDVTEDGMAIEDALSGPMLAERPEITWKYLRQISDVCRGKEPNREHTILADIEARIPGTWLLTQNVDGLHHKAGSKNLIEIHGRADKLYCTQCSQCADGEQVLYQSGLPPSEIPICALCEGLLRPDVVLFSEQLPDKEVAKLQNLGQTGVDLVLSIGTSSQFPYIAGPVFLAAELGIPTVEINPGKTTVSSVVSHRLAMPCGEALEAIWQAMC